MLRPLAIAGLVVFIATGCANDGADGGGDAVAELVAVDIDYQQAPETLPSGQVTVRLVNEGTLEHNVTIEELGDVLVVEADGGETASGTVTFDPGTYTLYCSVPGHREAGMETTVTVDG